MYDSPMSTQQEEQHPDDKMLSKVSSAASDIRWLGESYDDVKGKGAFKKQHPEAIKTMGVLLDKKVTLTMKSVGRKLGRDDGEKQKQTSGGLQVL